MRTGKVIAISGPVVDCKFEEGQLPRIKEALKVTVGDEERVMEVAQHVGNGVVRCIMLASSDDMSIDMEVRAEGRCISVPVGECTLGRMFNVLGMPIDGGAPIPDDQERWEIH